MSIKVGDRLPSVEFKTMTAEGPKAMTTEDIFKGQKVALFGVPGAFTPTCSAKHLPGFVAHAADLKDKGIDAVACVSVTTCLSWPLGEGPERRRKSPDARRRKCDFARATGLEVDFKNYGMGQRCKRFSMLVDDGVVKVLNIDESGFKLTSAEHLLEEI